MPEKFEELSPAEREMLEEATVDASKEGAEAAKYSPDQQMIIDAFEKIAAKSEAYRAIVESIKSRGIFEGKGDAFEQILASVKNLEKMGVSPDEIEAALDKQVDKMLSRYSDTRLAA